MASPHLCSVFQGYLIPDTGPRLREARSPGKRPGRPPPPPPQDARPRRGRTQTWRWELGCWLGYFRGRRCYFARLRGGRGGSDSRTLPGEGERARRDNGARGARQGATGVSPLPLSGEGQDAALGATPEAVPVPVFFLKKWHVSSLHILLQLPIQTRGNRSFPCPPPLVPRCAGVSAVCL